MTQSGRDRYRACFDAIIDRACGPEAREVALAAGRATFSKGVGVSCNKYQYTSPDCKRLLPPTGLKPKGKKSKSVLSRLISGITQV